MAKWNKEQTLFLIELYQQNPILYDSSDIHYANRIKREKTYEAILKEMETMKKNITLSEIKAKIKNLRCQFFKERQKVRSTEKSGAGADDIYVPKLWYYNELKFLQKNAEGDIGESNIPSEFPNHTEHDVGDGVQTEKCTKAEKPNLKKDALQALQLAANALAKGSKDERETDFVTFLTKELQKITIDEIYEETKWKILDLVRTGIGANKTALQGIASGGTPRRTDQLRTDILEIAMEDLIEESSN